MNGCREAGSLLDIYAAALSAFHKSQEPILAGLTPDNPEYEHVRELRDRAYESLFKARQLYLRHVRLHRCRGGANQAPAAPEDQQQDVKTPTKTPSKPRKFRSRMTSASVTRLRLICTPSAIRKRPMMHYEEDLPPDAKR
jgi:hypothetical protein